MNLLWCYSIANETEIFYSHTLIKRTMKSPTPGRIISDPKPVIDETIAGAPTFDEGLEFAPLSFVKRILRIA